MSTIPANVRENSGFGLPAAPGGPLFSSSLQQTPPSQTSLIDLDGLPQVSANFILLPNLDGAKLQQRQLLFLYRMKSAAVRYEAWNIANLTQMNTILREAGRVALGYLKSKQQLESSIPQRDMHSLMQWEEGSWRKHSAYNSIERHSDLRYIRQYLRAEDILDTWAFNGVLLADMSVGKESAPNQIFSSQLKGWCEVEDVWGGAAAPGLDLYLILKRVYSKETGSYAAFQFVPYVLPAGMCCVPPRETAYLDLSGSKQYGVTYRLGRVLDRPHGITPEGLRLVEAGLVSAPTDMDPSLSFGGVQRLYINLSAAPGSLLHYDS